jgi:hypothetical protein
MTRLETPYRSTLCWSAFNGTPAYVMSAGVVKEK